MTPGLHRLIAIPCSNWGRSPLFTALLIFRLQQRHLLDVTAPIGQYVEGLPSVWASTSLLQLLSHTSGIPNYLNEDNFLRLMPTNPAPVNCSQRWPSGRWRLRPVRGTPIPIRTHPARPGHRACNRHGLLAGSAGRRYCRRWACAMRDRVVPTIGAVLPRGICSRMATGAPPPLLRARHGRGSPASTTWRAAVALDQHRLLPESALKRMWCDTLLGNGSKAGWGPAGKFPMAER